VRKFRPKTAADRLRFARLERLIGACGQAAAAAQWLAAEQARSRARLAALFVPPGPSGGEG